MPEAPPTGVYALLGPTNTGKTHAALERLLQHPSATIGLPLRLLAREVYDRLSQRLGSADLQLVTGEERIGSNTARYRVCTVEAMPERPSDLVIVDEIQLCADPSRGHNFTDRLLHARGTTATLFLGSDAMRPAIMGLVPNISIDGRPRLSTLRHTGFAKLGSLPPKSAIIAFSAEQVYALAARARQKHGGCAVVMGALSPRTRNAQVALFQSGEVPVIVATDAIGMGLNLDLDHVAFSSIVKFDGEAKRRLYAGELAQIAGRAGRHTNDGSFGTTESCDQLPGDLVRAVETHTLPHVKRLWWRNPKLDLSTPRALLQSLHRPPPHPLLQRSGQDEDERALDLLVSHPDVLARCNSPERVALLWECCRTPDYRKSTPEHHAELVLRTFMTMVDHGHLRASWIQRQMDTLDRIDTPDDARGLDVLTQRLAWIRTWAYMCQRQTWIDHPRGLSDQAASIESRLSDALHEELKARFVGTRHEGRVTGAARVTDDRVELGGVGLGRLQGFSFVPDRPGQAAGGARAAIEAAVGAKAERFLTKPEVRVSDNLTLNWEGAALARLMPGERSTEPKLRLLSAEYLRPGLRLQVERMLTTLLRDWVNSVLAPLRPGGRSEGVAYLLEDGLGTVPMERVAGPRATQTPAERKRMVELGIRFGAEWAWCAGMWGGDRRVLAAVASGAERAPEWPQGVVVSGGAGPGGSGGGSTARMWTMAGFVPWGEDAVRVDAYEAWRAQIRGALRAGPAQTPEGVTDVMMRAYGLVATSEGWVRRRR